MTVEITSVRSTNDVNFQRSASAPVGIVQVVSMNTIWKKNIVATAGVNRWSGSMKPLVPARFQVWPKRFTASGAAESDASPPKVAIGPMEPICRPKPTK